ncbi:hypothetical protein GPECTOR_80g150 [Gonium pectorale]|uniref:Guanylate cyclase domain-containing protein n=1 Tax=Gonium pectorale TaxID=33097 RepID=A0A150G3A2_GONPE|nr:hypothetical protein GPECTOR_80g150 [Gonium pectorale]|eukprot:KXZ43790.1 hypothetical protein GPECTOR_80g150 [Gonium pectorale]
MEVTTVHVGGAGGQGALAGGGEGVPTGGVRWHEVAVKPVVDPMSGERVLLLVQTDVSKQVAAEEVLASVLEAEHRLLADVFPQHVVADMTAARNASAEAARRGFKLLGHIQDPAALATSHECITILFADIKGFTCMCKEVPPAAVMTFLNDLYTRLDSLTDVYGVYKVETIGDCYMVAGGLVARGADGIGTVVRGGESDPLAAQRVVSFARAMLAEAAAVRLPNTGEPVQMRIGIHSGPATSGVVGAKMPRFCLFGDTVNTASRMESTGTPGCIHISAATRALLPATEDELGWAPSGGVEVKGKGTMDTFLWAPNSEAAARQRAEQRRTASILGTVSARAIAAAAAEAAAAPSVAGGAGPGSGSAAAVTGGAPAPAHPRQGKSSVLRYHSH